MAHVFLSYVKENAVQADFLYNNLRAIGLDIWIDKKKLLPGIRWKDELHNAIQKGAFFIALFSEESTARDRSYMNEELLLAIEELRLRPRDRAWFIPVLLSECEVPKISIGAGETLHDIQRVDFYRDINAGMRQIVQAIDSNALPRLTHVVFQVVPFFYNYQAGTKIAGIQWHKGFSDLRVIVANTSDDEYTNVDIWIRTDIGIAKVGTISDIVQSVATPAMAPPSPIVLAGTPEGQVAIPGDQYPEMNEHIVPQYRVHCERLPPRTHLMIVVAAIKGSGDVMKVGSLFDVPRVDPTWVEVLMDYTFGANRFRRSHFQDFWRTEQTPPSP